MASRICFGTMGWMSTGERQEKRDQGREEMRRGEEEWEEQIARDGSQEVGEGR